MGVSIEDIKKLKELSGIGLTDAKKALVEAEGDFDKALEALRKKGLTKAEKKGDRETREGLIESYVHSGRIGVFWLVINGGTRQDVAQFHAHVVRLPDERGSLGDRLRSSTLAAAFAEARAILERRRGWRGYSFQVEIRAETDGAVSAWLIRDGLNPAAH